VRIECEACHELVEAKLAIDGGVATMTCPKCDAKTTIREEPKPEPEPPPRDVCAKCGSARTGDPNCKTCGLAADKAATYIATRDAAVPEIVKQTWKRATDDWAEQARHDAMLRIVTEHGCFAWAAAMYRDQAALRGDDMSKRQLDRVLRGAEALLYATRTDPKPRVLLRAITIALAILLVGMVAFLVFIVSQQQ
jgi:hypothetical protein